MDWDFSCAQMDAAAKEFFAGFTAEQVDDLIAADARHAAEAAHRAAALAEEAAKRTELLKAQEQTAAPVRLPLEVLVQIFNSRILFTEASSGTAVPGGGSPGLLYTDLLADKLHVSKKRGHRGKDGVRILLDLSQVSQLWRSAVDVVLERVTSFSIAGNTQYNVLGCQLLLPRLPSVTDLRIYNDSRAPSWVHRRDFCAADYLARRGKPAYKSHHLYQSPYAKSMWGPSEHVSGFEGEPTIQPGMIDWPDTLKMLHVTSRVVAGSLEEVANCCPNLIKLEWCRNFDEPWMIGGAGLVPARQALTALQQKCTCLTTLPKLGLFSHNERKYDSRRDPDVWPDGEGDDRLGEWSKEGWVTYTRDEDEEAQEDEDNETCRWVDGEHRWFFDLLRAWPSLSEVRVEFWIDGPSPQMREIKAFATNQKLFSGNLDVHAEVDFGEERYDKPSQWDPPDIDDLFMESGPGAALAQRFRDRPNRHSFTEYCLCHVCAGGRWCKDQQSVTVKLEQKILSEEEMGELAIARNGGPFDEHGW